MRLNNPVVIGNDIIDICSSENLTKHKNNRLTRRVLSSTERNSLSTAQFPQWVFLAQWAAKEATYKLLKKLHSELLFSHAKFDVKGAEHITHHRKTTGTVTYQGDKHVPATLLDVQWERSPQWIHCVATQPKIAPAYVQKIQCMDEKLLGDNFSSAEMVSIYSDQSKAVRNLAKHLLKNAGFGDTQIIRYKEARRYSPPWVYSGQQRILKIDISLSHDGKYMAAVLAGINAENPHSAS
ncbi:MAG: 4'-phosphopantetheinyl transferase superfamily protein [Pseudomonadales bacterium]|nr:4'-phosphopantetheinyl transferase superfamily protein [Pseudomonadales bacterium]